MTKNGIDETQEIRENQNLSATAETLSVSVENLDETSSEAVKVTEMSKQIKNKFIIFCVVAILAGTLTGFGASKLKGKENKGPEITQNVESVDKIKAGDVFGVTDQNTFADSAQGYLEKGGIEGEGSHKLLREGGSTQTVTLTSSVADLDQFEGMEIKIWGETNKAQNSGWFMDVGRIEVIVTDAQAPIQTLD